MYLRTKVDECDAEEDSLSQYGRVNLRKRKAAYLTERNDIEFSKSFFLSFYDENQYAVQSLNSQHKTEDSERTMQSKRETQRRRRRNGDGC